MIKKRFRKIEEEEKKEEGEDERRFIITRFMTTAIGIRYPTARANKDPSFML